MGDDESQTNETTSDAARTDEQPAKPNASRATRVNVRVESYDHPRGVNGKNGRRNLPRIYQIVGVSAEVHGSSQLAEQPALRRPGAPPPEREPARVPVCRAASVVRGAKTSRRPCRIISA